MIPELLSEYPMGSDLTILNTFYQYPTYEDGKKKNDDFLIIVYQDNKTGIKNYKVIKTPTYTYYKVKPGNEVNYCRLFIEKDKVEAIIVLPRELFYTTDISVTFWILNQNKCGGVWHDRRQRDRRGQILFMDLRQWTQNPVKGEQKKKVALSTEQIKRATEIFFRWQNEGTDGSSYAEPELFRSVGIEELRENDFSLVPSRYIEFVDRDLKADYEKVLSETTATISDLLSRQSANETTLRNALKQLGYDCK